jgi:hypothetical protein
MSQESIVRFCRRSLAVAALAWLPAMVQAAPANMLIYIHPQEYKHPVKLWQYYADFWYEQGPLVESLAQEMLTQTFGETGMCGVVNEARALVWLQPRMYYNPHMTTYYGVVRASVYTSSGEPVATYLGEARKHGFLDVQPRKQVEEVYRMERLIENMQQDTGLQKLVSEGAISRDAGGACAIVPNLPPPKLIELDYLIKSVH